MLIVDSWSMPGYSSNSQPPAQQLTHVTRLTRRWRYDNWAPLFSCLPTFLFSSNSAALYIHASLLRSSTMIRLLLEATLFTLTIRHKSVLGWHGALLPATSVVLPLVVNRPRTTSFLLTAVHDKHQTIRRTTDRLRSAVDARIKLTYDVTFSIGISIEHWYR